MNRDSGTHSRYRPIRPSYAGHGDGYASVLLEEGWNEMLIKPVRTDAADDV